MLDLIRINIKRFFNAIGHGDIERVQETLAAGVEPNIRDKRGQPAIIKAVRALTVESGVVDALLDAGADLNATAPNGLTALDYARRRLARLGDGPDPVSKSRSLDEHGNLILDAEEEVFIEQMRREHPDRGDEFAEMYVQERRKAAVRQYMPRRELRIIIDRLESVTTT